jgi:hypothetical protein
MKKPVAFKDNTVAEEALPLKRVLYPGFYGAYFAFQEDEKSPITICSCSFESIENYLKIKDKADNPNNSSVYRNYIIDSGNFPLSLVQHLKDNNRPNDYSIIRYLKFSDKLCHECNRATPTYRYCHEMYGGIFKQTYGWYIQKKGLEYGVFGKWRFYQEYAPQELIDLMEITPAEYHKYISIHPAGRTKEGSAFNKRFNKQMRKVWNIIENEAREKLGHKKVGDSWVSETVLYYIIKSIFPDKIIHRHFRPDYLEKLELDIFIEDLKIGIEYQGIQHFEPVDYWGGNEAFERGQERDKRKRKLCSQNQITLVCFNHNEPLERDYIKNKIEEIL